MAIKKYGRTVNIFDDTNIIEIPNVGDRYGVIVPSGTYSIYNGTDNIVYYGRDNWTARSPACQPHTTATITLNVGSGGGFFMPYNSASQGGCTIVVGETPPDHYIPYRDWLVHGYKKYGTETETFTTLPHEVIGDGTAISAWSMKGNMQQSGTPTPSTPIYPTEVGEETANLFDKDNALENKVYDEYGNLANAAVPAEQWYASNYIKVEYGKTYIRSSNGTAVGNVYNTYDADKNFIERFTPGTGVPFTINNPNVEYITFALRNTNTPLSTYQLNEGSTALPFEPHGYKIPISFGQNTYNIYISEPLRKSLDGSNVYDELSSNGTLTRRVDENGDALATPTTEQVTVPTLTTTGTPEQFNVLTTLAPSEVSLTYHGWHEHSDEKYVGGVNLSPITAFTNTTTDSRDFFKPRIRVTLSGVQQEVIAPADITTTGAVSYTVSITKTNDALTFFHSGANRNINIFTIENGVPQGTYTLSFDVEGYDCSTVGGLALSNIEFKDSGHWE